MNNLIKDTLLDVSHFDESKYYFVKFLNVVFSDGYFKNVLVQDKHENSFLLSIKNQTIRELFQYSINKNENLVLKLNKKREITKIIAKINEDGIIINDLDMWKKLNFK